MSGYSTAQASTILGRMGFAGSSAQRISAFQYGYNLGTPLTVDGLVGSLTSAAIARSVAAGGKASANFTWLEFRCKCGGRYTSCRRILVDRKLLVGLERYRKLPGVGAVSIISGYRCPSYNKVVGGASSSQHLLGKAADILPRKTTAEVNAMRYFNGKGYQRSSGKVVHVDVRASYVTPWQYAS